MSFIFWSDLGPATYPVLDLEFGPWFPVQKPVQTGTRCTGGDPGVQDPRLLRSLPEPGPLQTSKPVQVVPDRAPSIQDSK